ncbi:MAG TPA: bifunctional methylenetetrahydrofolate dehydrogenase/methenyltetrahydrofolate cyclohydrolase FolD [Lachnospiraceae bacterium]|nr:bifunctional methylenetetrahydrofolate dehydrogenase/methenyltetrahydrofolate cyclohydrolase FolD [Lachnospiraceae bacterium]MBQ5534600.1 bifunctional methylenetetrahydrofolate dehydrogenase/methenyltetrahydrofolate cyclohydrolase FolD [Lachnospiraceae bacterium]MBQ9566799.1 bifunctional methylenetetrahydrofolate dehydrogenase/methenyltetrahydrofolate cyclohydrolase FolD [Lachnospiraceae bacterium]MCR4785120.1 bifunctional methylenetetrahydrofolate dehydrogenase/methenyltetrahydrofolate cyclo
MAKIIDGKKISQDIKDEIKAEIEKEGIKACLAVIIVGEDPASKVYVKNKKTACEYCGIRSLSYELPESTTEEELIGLIGKLNDDSEVDGILVQLPVPEHINEDRIIEAIDPSKDVDGFSRRSVGALSIGTKGFVSCTPAGIIELLKRSDVEMEGKECVVMGRSNIVGKPMAMLMLRENATVTVVHSRTKRIEEVCSRADILIVAIGKPELVTHEYVKDGATVIDVGIHRLDPEKNGGRKLCGDVDYEDVAPIAGAITPVPGGVGPMTIAMLMKNVLISARDRKNGMS